MEGNNDNKSIVRKPILTNLNRRNAKNNPEFLDTEVLLKRYEPLLKSIHKHFCSYNGIFNQPDDSSDLYSQIVYEFLRLRRDYDPKRGVDFPGYIKFTLQQRVYHYVTKKQKQMNIEQPVRNYGDSSEDQYLELENFSELIDEESEENFEKVEAMNSIPWDDLSEDDAELVRDILINKQTIESIAKRDNVSMKSVKLRIDNICDLFIELHNISMYHDK